MEKTSPRSPLSSLESYRECCMSRLTRELLDAFFSVLLCHSTVLSAHDPTLRKDLFFKKAPDCVTLRSRLRNNTRNNCSLFCVDNECHVPQMQAAKASDARQPRGKVNVFLNTSIVQFQSLLFSKWYSL
jgi:hypothetical protein